MAENAAADKKVLVVDDTPLVRKMVAARLRLAGYAVTEAADGGEALERFKSAPSAVVITDLCMPRLDGLSLLAALRQHAFHPEDEASGLGLAARADAALYAAKRAGRNQARTLDAAAAEAAVRASEPALELPA